MNARTPITSDITHYIGGARSAGTSARAQDVTNPATGAVTGNVALANSAEVSKAVAAAQAAFPAWADTPPLRRARQQHAAGQRDHPGGKHQQAQGRVGHVQRAAAGEGAAKQEHAAQGAQHHPLDEQGGEAEIGPAITGRARRHREDGGQAFAGDDRRQDDGGLPERVQRRRGRRGVVPVRSGVPHPASEAAGRRGLLLGLAVGATPCNWPSSGNPFDFLPLFRKHELKLSVNTARVIVVK